MKSILLLTELLPWFGRFHPILVHLPIGFIIIGFLLELFGRRKNLHHLLLSVRFVLWLGALSSLLTAATGYYLSLEGGYGERSVFNHQWSGIVVTLVIFLTVFLKNTKAYIWLLSAAVTGILITGHLGGNMTHGSGYLTEHAPKSVKKVFGIEDKDYSEPKVTYEEAKMYKHVVYPILKDKCMGCHNESKMKGDLNMKSFVGLLKGGENGKVLLKHDSEGSEMIKRIHLPEDNDDTMPPEGKERITDEELKLIAYWIDEDGKEETALDSLNISEEIEEVIRYRLSRSDEKISPVFSRDVDKTTEERLEKLQDFGFSVLAVERGSPFLQINYFNGFKPIDEEAKKALISVSEQLVWLNLSGAKTEGDNWDFLLKLPYLSRLDLSGTTIGNEVVLQLAELEYLEMLNLFGTKVDKKILESLYRAKNLKSLYLGNTEIQSVDTTAIKKTGNIYLEVGF